MNIMFLNTCVNLYQRNILVDLQKNLLKKGKKWELYDKDDYKECQNAIVFGSTKKHTSKLWKIQNKSQRLKNEIERTHNTLTTDKKLIVFELANNHMGDLKHAINIIKKYSNFKKKI